jgi:hypothetical protein
MTSIDDAVTELSKAYYKQLDYDAAAKVLEEVGACRMQDLRKALTRNSNGDISVDFIDSSKEKVTFLVPTYGGGYAYHPFATTVPIDRCKR